MENHFILTGDTTAPFIGSTTENWTISASCYTPEGEQRELVTIGIAMPGKTWIGTIQDLQAVFNIMQNSLAAMKECMESESCGFEYFADCREELEAALSHLK